MKIPEQEKNVEGLDSGMRHASDDGSNSKAPLEPQSHDIATLESAARVSNEARLSTVGSRASGPRTARGKERSSQNALKHGLFSKAALLRGESRRELSRLLDGLQKNYQPVDMIDSICVDMLVSTIWIRRRLLIAEGKEMERAMGIPHEMGRLDLLIRYGAYYDRKFDRLLKQLERLQRMRLGQLPPSIEVKVSSDE